MSSACRYDGCTVGDTGRCALEQDPLVCSYRVTETSDNGLESPSTPEVHQFRSDDFGASVLDAPVAVPTFPPSTTLGPKNIAEMMASRYVTIVGILGDPNSGKTAALASLYLLISNDRLDGYTFADSHTLMGFEDIARGARHWNEGNPPEEMTSHTEMADERRPGFLHLRLRRDRDGRCVELALPDLPGEWTKELVRTSNSDRLQFLASADVIWIVVDGRTLNDKVQRQGVITRLGQLVKRLPQLMAGAAIPRLLLVVTHHDEGEVLPDTIKRVHAEMYKHGVEIDVIPIASFSDNQAIKAGFGLQNLISATVDRAVPSQSSWPSVTPKLNGRNFLAYRRDR